MEDKEKEELRESEENQEPLVREGNLDLLDHRENEENVDNQANLDPKERADCQGKLDSQENADLRERGESPAHQDLLALMAKLGQMVHWGQLDLQDLLAREDKLVKGERVDCLDNLDVKVNFKCFFSTK